MKNWISTTISIVALGIAIVAMAKVAPAHELDFDYYGAIIGVLSFLVTLLMTAMLKRAWHCTRSIVDLEIGRSFLMKMGGF